jgi:hypothetical protein
MMPTVGLEEALSDTLISPEAGNVSTAGGILTIKLYLMFEIVRY